MSASEALVEDMAHLGIDVAWAPRLREPVWFRADNVLLVPSRFEATDLRRLGGFVLDSVWGLGADH